MYLYDEIDQRLVDERVAQVRDQTRRFMDGKHPYWAWAHVHAFDIQTGRMTRLEQVRTISGGHATQVNNAGIYERYLTNAALMRLGSG